MQRIEYIPTMALTNPSPTPRSEPIPIDARAADHLRYIRETMERAGEFTAVPGWGGVAMGITAIAAAYFASLQTTPARWLLVWLLEAGIAVAIAAPAAATKAHRANAQLFSGPGRKFLLSFGTAIVTGGAFSVRVVPVMGLCLMILGAVALFAPAQWGDALMASGFGGVQIGFGVWIARRFGG